MKWVLYCILLLTVSACFGYQEEEPIVSSTSSALGCFVCPEHQGNGGGATGGGNTPDPDIDDVYVIAPKKKAAPPSTNPDGTGTGKKDNPGRGASGNADRTPNGTRINCASPGWDCVSQCSMAGAACPISIQNPSNPAGPMGILQACKTGNPTHTCSYKFINGDRCTGVFTYFGGAVVVLCDKMITRAPNLPNFPQ